MKIRQQPTARAAFHALTNVDSQETRIARLLAYHTNAGHDTTLGEIAHILRMEKSTTAARLNGLRNTRNGERRAVLLDGCEYEVFLSRRRKCSRSGITCAAWQLLPAVAGQLSLFNHAEQ